MGIEEFSDNLKYIRKCYGYKQPEMSKMLDVPTSRYGSWEEKRAVPSISGLLLISKKLGFTMNELIEDDISITYDQISILLKQPVH